MKIRTRLAIRFTLIVASLLAVFAVAIFYFSSYYHQKQFYNRLEEKAGNYAHLVAHVNHNDINLVTLFDTSTAYLPNERILVYDKNNQQLFNTRKDSYTISKKFLNRVRIEKRITWTENGNEILAVYYNTKHQSLVVVVSASDTEGRNELATLKLILLIGYIICVAVTMLAGWIFAGRALKPISGVVSQVENITVSSLAERVNAGSDNDEIGQLALTFNRMLERIQKSFELQKSFVSNSSHELRTPLTSITGQLEVALMNKRAPEEYQEVLTSVLEDIKNVNRLTNGLLDLAQAEMDISRLKLKGVRLDELLWSARADLLKRNSRYKVNIEMQGFPEDENKLTVTGSEHLLRSALLNVMDNACKFSSDNQVDISLEIKNSTIEISFTDKGIGISEEEIIKITQPFYRGLNAKMYPGHGLGLSLTAKIMDLHQGEILVSSSVGKFTRVKLIFQSWVS